MKNSEEQKEMITTGMIRWWRYLIAPFVILISLEMIQNGTCNAFKVLILIVLSGLVFLLWAHRRLKFDSRNLYIKRGNKETAVPLANIVSIKKSKTQVNSDRYWILIYMDELKNKRKLRFKSDFNKEFHTAVKENNPAVVIWTHPYFNH